MRVFVTGATGFIGSKVVLELLSAGHQVLGLARSEGKAKVLAATGAEVLMGDLEDLNCLRKGASECDGVAHLGFIHDFANFQVVCKKDAEAITAMGEVLKGTNKPLVVTSGTLMVARMGSDEPATELDKSPFTAAQVPRIQSEEAAMYFATQGVRASVVRLSPSVHDDDDHGFIPMIIDMARQNGEAAYIGEGLNKWPAVHRLDAAKLFRLALEKGEAGDVFHGAGDTGIQTKDIAAAIGKELNLPVVSKSGDEAAAHFTWMTHFFSMNNPLSNELTKQKLGWEPTHPGLIEDLETGSYFK
jgi:nucleoside-diphosphate-sugar epimerase